MRPVRADDDSAEDFVGRGCGLGCLAINVREAGKIAPESGG